MSPPMPKTRQGWIAFFALVFGSFLFYYLCLHSFLEQAYYDSLWTAEPFPLEKSPLELDVHIPRYTYSFVEREIRIQVRNPDPEKRFQVNVVVAVVDPPASMFVLLCSEESGKATGCDQGTNVLSLGELAPSAIVTRSVWITAQKTNSEGEEKGEAGNPNETLRFQIVIETKEATKEDGTAGDDGATDKETQRWTTEIVSLSAGGVSRINAYGAFVQSFVNTILLPPWSNGVLPVVVLFTVLLFDESRLRGRRCWLAVFMIQAGILLIAVDAAQLALTGLDWRDGREVPALEVWAGVIMFLGGAGLCYGGYRVRQSSACSPPATPPGDQGTGASSSQSGPPGAGLGTPGASLQQTEAKPGAGSPPPQALLGKLLVEHDQANDLRALLNQTDSTISVLSALQRRHPHLPDFEARFALLDAPSPALHYPILGDAVRATPAGELTQCTEPKILESLLDLCEEETPPAFKDGTALADALVMASTPAVDQAIRARLQSGRPADHLLNRLMRSSRPVRDLVSFFDVLPRVDEERYQKQWWNAFSALDGRREEMLEAYAVVIQFLEKGRKESQNSLLDTLSDDEALMTKVLSLCQHVAERSPLFAKWFIYEELPYLPENMDEQFLNILRQTASALRAKAKDGALKGTSQSFQTLVHHDWDKAVPDILADQPPAFDRRLRAILTSLARGKLE